RRPARPRQSPLPARSSRPDPSEPRYVGEGERTAPDMHAAEFGTAKELRKYLPGIEEVLRIKRALHTHLVVEVDVGEHLRHQVPLLDADPVLAGQHAADLHAQAQYVGAEALRPVELARYIGVVEDQRMQIAVAGVEDIGDPQPIAFGEFPHPG